MPHRNNNIPHRNNPIAHVIAHALVIATVIAAVIATATATATAQPATDLTIDAGTPTIAPTPAEPAAEPADPSAPTVGASLDRTDAHVGDRLTLTVSAIAKAAVAGTVHLATTDLGKFEILDQSASDRDLGDGKTSRRFVLQIAAYDLGDLEIPPISIDYASAAGGTRTLKTTAIPVHIQKIIDEDKPQLQPLRSLREILVEDKRPLEALIGGALALLLLIAVLIARAVMRRRRMRPMVAAPAVVRPPDDVALEKLRQLRARGRYADDAFRPFHFSVAEIVRGYLGARFGFDSLELTTTELLDELRAVRERLAQHARTAGAPLNHPPLDLDHYTRIRGFLEDCDLVKFAKASSSDDQAIAILDRAEGIVVDTSQMPQPGVEEGRG